MIQPVILCGGPGTRLWPLSRKSFPKQFVPLIGGRSLLQLTHLTSSRHVDTLYQHAGVTDERSRRNRNQGMG
jgi:mannose-1-phosphate guanylyltransferase